MNPNLGDFINGVIDVASAVIPFLGAVALFAFAFGIARFIRSAGNEKELSESKNIIIWGIIGMFVLFSVWGIIAFIRGEFGLSGDVGIPQLPTTSNNSGGGTTSVFLPCGQDPNQEGCN